MAHIVSPHNLTSVPSFPWLGTTDYSELHAAGRKYLVCATIDMKVSRTFTASANEPCDRRHVQPLGQSDDVHRVGFVCGVPWAWLTLARIAPHLVCGSS